MPVQEPTPLSAAVVVPTTVAPGNIFIPGEYREQQDLPADDTSLIPDEENEENGHRHFTRNRGKSAKGDVAAHTSSTLPAPHGPNNKLYKSLASKLLLIRIRRGAIDQLCHLVTEAITDQPQCNAGRDNSLPVEDNLYNNSLAYQLWDSHIDRLQELKVELRQRLTLWHNWAIDLTPVAARNEEMAFKESHLARQGGHTPVSARLNRHLTVAATAKAQAATALEYYKSVQAKEQAQPAEQADTHVAKWKHGGRTGIVWSNSDNDPLRVHCHDQQCAVRKNGGCDNYHQRNCHKIYLWVSTRNKLY
ncbi:hypothetical protein AAVH_17924 [Aphelenchoides avenae]|nr:hypothetical protein AAVH_17924 [Aphelenchus avenae]